jgi:hypothetical protein
MQYTIKTQRYRRQYCFVEIKCCENRQDKYLTFYLENSFLYGVKMRVVKYKITFSFFVRDLFTSNKFQTNERKSPTMYCE